MHRLCDMLAHQARLNCRRPRVRRTSAHAPLLLWPCLGEAPTSGYPWVLAAGRSHRYLRTPPPLRTPIGWIIHNLTTQQPGVLRCTSRPHTPPQRRHRGNNPSNRACLSGARLEGAYPCASPHVATRNASHLEHRKEYGRGTALTLYVRDFAGRCMQ